MKNTVTTTYGALVNGDRIWICGHLFTVANRRVSFTDGGRDVVRFEGVIADQADNLFQSSYNGGVYGAFADVPCTIANGGA